MINSTSFNLNETNNPVYLSALGVAPLVVMSKSFVTGLFIGAVFVVNLFFSALVISSLRSMVPHITRLAYILSVSTACVSVLGLLTQAVFYQLHLSVSNYLPMIAMNCLVLYFLETGALTHPLRYTLRPLCHISALILMICLLVGSMREYLAFGGLDSIMEIAPVLSGNGEIILPGVMKMSIFTTASGAFIITGCVFALINILLDKSHSD